MKSSKFSKYISRELLKKRVNFLSQVQSRENLQNILLVTAAVFTGLVAVLYAKLFKWAELNFLDFFEKNESLVFLLTPISFLIAWWLIFRFSPEASGSGIPQVLASNELDDDGDEKVQIGRFLSLRIIVVKTFSSIICVLGGGAIGREGPTIQISASIFYLFGEKVKKYLPESKSHLWIISGASAGLAAAFNTPLGGIVYAIEELGGAHFNRVRTILLAAIVTSGLIAQWLLGNYLYLGAPNVRVDGGAIVLIAILVGGVSGLAGASFSGLLFRLSQLRRKIKSAGKLALITVICGLLMAGLIYFERKSSGSGLESLNDFLFHAKSADGYLVLGRYFGTILSYLSGAAGGIFSPSLAIGGSLGSYMARWFDSYDQNIFVLLGMIGFLTAVTKTPCTSFILVLEMTNKHAAIFPMMVAALVAQLSSNLINHHSFYERIKEVYQEALAAEKIKLKID